MNKVIIGNKCTVLWHVDNLKISHINKDVVLEIINLLEKEFRKEAPLTKNRGKVHKYLGITIDFLTPGKVIFSMLVYVQHILDALHVDMSDESATPASLFLI